MSKFSDSIFPSLIIAILANFLIYYFIYTQISAVNAINEHWQTVQHEHIESAVHLTEIERSLGYVGFIHHFKNYIIRGNKQYYELAKLKLEAASREVAHLKTHQTLNRYQLMYVKVIEQVLEEYSSKLALAMKQKTAQNPADLDRMVKVDDSPAERALIKLRSEIMPRLKAEQNSINKRVERFGQRTLALGLSLIPLFLFTTLLTLFTLRKQANNLAELTTIFNASPDGIIYLNSHGQVCKVNDAAKAMFAYSEQEFLQLRLEQLLLNPDDAMCCRSLASNYADSHANNNANNTEMSGGSDKLCEAAATDQAVFQRPQSNAGSATYQQLLDGKRSDGSLIELSVIVVSKQLHKEMMRICVLKDMTAINALHKHSHSDHLTSLSNRRHFDNILEAELNSALYSNREASLLLIDLDNFKTLNDVHGHLEGDEALKLVAEFLLAHSRDSDYVCRWGGDEFVVFCPHMASSEAQLFGERLRSNFEVININPACPLTLSIGIASTQAIKPLNPKNVLDAADQAVYRAKRAGKNCVIHYGDL